MSGFSDYTVEKCVGFGGACCNSSAVVSANCPGGILGGGGTVKCANYAQWNTPIVANYVGATGISGECCELLLYQGNDSYGGGCAEDCATGSATLSVSVVPCLSSDSNPEGRCVNNICTAQLIFSTSGFNVTFNWQVNATTSTSICSNNWVQTTPSGAVTMAPGGSCMPLRTECAGCAGFDTACSTTGFYQNEAEEDCPHPTYSINASLSC